MPVGGLCHVLALQFVLPQLAKTASPLGKLELQSGKSLEFRQLGTWCQPFYEMLAFNNQILDSLHVTIVARERLYPRQVRSKATKHRRLIVAQISLLHTPKSL